MVTRRNIKIINFSWRDIRTLVRCNVSLMVSVATAFGYLMVYPVIDDNFLWVCLGTFCLSCACTIWNQIQEREIDVHFSRTRERALASGRMPLWLAWYLSFLLVLVAAVSLFNAGGGLLVCLGGGVIFLYNGLYTPLKQKTAFALLVGSIAGALPPVLGWKAAGGVLDDPVIGLIFILYYVWQIPHFWLRIEQDREEYLRYGTPVLPSLLEKQRYARLLRVWFYAYAVGVVMLPVFPFLHSVPMRVGITILGVGLFLCFGTIRTRTGRGFIYINVSLALVMGGVLMDRLLL